jgi:hypothetical protein
VTQCFLNSGYTAQVTWAGYGRLGTCAGTNTSTGRLRNGDNRYDFRFGDNAWGAGYWDGAFDDPTLPSAQVSFSYLSNFDNSLASNEASWLLAAETDVTITTGSSQFRNIGVGAPDAGVAGGDSGGPNFIKGFVAKVNSNGLSFGMAYGDVNGTLNSTLGQFSLNPAVTPSPGAPAAAVAARRQARSGC